MLPVFYQRLRVAVALDDDGLRLVIVEVDVLLQRAGVLRAHDLHRPSREPLELLDLALVKLEPHNPEKLTHEWHAAHADARACRPIALLAIALGCDLPRRAHPRLLTAAPPCQLANRSQPRSFLTSRVVSTLGR